MRFTLPEKAGFTLVGEFEAVIMDIELHDYIQIRKKK